MREYNMRTNADVIRSMDNEQLANFIKRLVYDGKDLWSEAFRKTFCDQCDPVEELDLETGCARDVYPCDYADGICPHGDDILWWLRQPVEIQVIL